jgi:uncharacterized protein involved in high-affinity Fe2+ transport
MKFKRLAMLAVMVITVLALGVFMTGCDNGDDPNGDGPGGGFEEFDLGDAHDFTEYGISVAGVYFQAVDMVPANMAGLAASVSDAHIEADISALAGNKLGFGAGDFVPFLTVRYEISVSGSSELLHEGTFMNMNASDGPHYGANVVFGSAKGQAGSYKIKFIIEVPDTYLLHSDSETGVTGRLWETPLEVEWTFNFIPFSA